MKAKFKKIRNFIFPAFVGSVYLFLYIPIIVLILFSFNSSGISWNSFTLKWYYDLFQSPEIWAAFSTSLIVSVSAVVLSLTLGVFLVWGLSEKFSFLISIFYSAMMIPSIVIAVGLLVFFDFFSIPLGLTTLIAGHTLLGLGFAIPIIYSRYLELDNQIIEASLDLGASNWQTFVNLIVPFLSPALISAAFSVFIVSLDDLLISFFCAGSSSQTLSLYIFGKIRSGVHPMINALSTLILIVSSLLVLSLSLVKIKVDVERSKT